MFKFVTEGMLPKIWVCVLAAMLSASWSDAATASSSKSKSSSTKKSTSSSKSSSSSSKKSSSSSSSKSSKPKDADKEDDAPRSKNPDQEDEKEEKSASKPKEETPTTTSVDRLPSLVDSVVAAASKAAHWGVKITNPATGQALYERNANEGFIPASNRKIFTGALALDQLGPDFRFRTFLYRNGNMNGGNLNGSLVIVPSGDPTFSRELYRSTSSDWVYRDWAQKVAEAGIKTVSGDLLIDCSAWDLTDLVPRGWAERVLQDNYAPQTSPLTLNENLITVIVNPGTAGEAGKISFAPPATGYPVINQTVTGKSGRVSVRRTAQGIVVSGTVTKAGQGGQLPCDNPTLFAAANFRHHLREKGVHVNGSVRIVGKNAGLPGWNNDTLIAMVESPPLTEILNHMMKQSDNHMAEQIYVAVSAHKLGRGSYTASKQLESALLQKAGMDPRGVQAWDGSGLSEANRVTPSQICSLLNYMLTHPHATPFYDSMAIGGVDGTLRNRMGSEKLRGRVHAKTGTINKVSTLSGYFRLNDQQMLTFSFLVNDMRGGSVRGSQDRIISILSSLVL